MNGYEKVQDEVSGFYVANEVRTTKVGMDIALESSAWEIFHSMRPETLAAEMLTWAKHVRLPKYKRHPRGPKKPVPKRTRYATETHVSTAQLLAKARKKSP